jgi:YlmC/YmxH family sporulation protein
MCRIADMRNKEVINICDGRRLGFVYDVEIDTCDGKVLAIVVVSPCPWFWFFGRDEEYVISWCDIERIGDDIILVKYDVPVRREPTHKRWC